MTERGLLCFSPFTGRRCPEGADEGRRDLLLCWALPLICLPASSPRKRGEGLLPLAHHYTFKRRPS
ncbi:MAG: hypothetical protein E5X43_12495 [Mesorhizobium sp.]|nr:MAG: hypothetical protein EOR45_19225 [Mesorhizobium sp.]TJW98496.1 MAG: hypothetical protein E5X43_12495 [Mesorhizobium sp.]